MGLIEEFAEALVERYAEELPESAIHESRRTMLNVFGTAIGASHSAEADLLMRAAERVGGGEIAPPGRTELVDRYLAALQIGFTAHYDDFDDTHLDTVIHPGAATLGALYPMAVLAQMPARETLQAFALGVESQLRIGIAMSPSHYGAGWHITGTCGVVGATVCAGLLAGFDGARLAGAIDVALNLTVGQREAFGTPVKPLHAGKAASNGLLACALAPRAIGDDYDILERDRGFFAVFGDEFDESLLTRAGVQSGYILLDNTYKPFPCGIVAHPAIEAAIDLHDRLGVDKAISASAIVLGCNPLVPELMGRTSVNTGLEARFCALHGVAVGLLLGRAGIAEFSDERAVDPAVVSLRSRSMLAPEESCPRSSATVTLEFADGSREVAEVAVATGSLERPMSDDQLLAKFFALVEPVLPGQSARLADTIMDVGNKTSMIDVATLLSES